jgi:hypothetical protein
MSYSSCIQHPNKNRYTIVYEWQIIFCQNNHCAALLLSFFSSWHDWKIQHDQYYRRANNITEAHGDGRPNNENAYLFFSTEQLIEGCMGFYGKKAIADALELLTTLGVIKPNSNPNPRYHFDKTKYFQFYPHVCNRWIAENYSNGSNQDENDSQVVDLFDNPKMADRLDEKDLPSAKNSRPSSEKARYITNTKNNTTNNNNLINTEDDLVKKIIKFLIAKGLSAKHMDQPDNIELIKKLCKAGSTVEIFSEAFEISTEKASQGFGFSYLSKVVESLLTKSKKANNKNLSNNFSDKTKYVYESNFKNAMSWAEDLV